MNSVEEIREGIPRNLRWVDKCKIPCLDCGEYRWVPVKSIMRKEFKGWCKGCSSKHRVIPSHYKDSSIRHKLNRGRAGYVLVSLPPNDPCLAMADKNRIIMEHRLVVADAMGRCLKRQEVVHHINRIKDDNRIQNLALVSNKRHQQFTVLESRIDYLERLLRKNNLEFNGG